MDLSVRVSCFLLNAISHVLAYVRQLFLYMNITWDTHLEGSGSHTPVSFFMLNVLFHCYSFGCCDFSLFLVSCLKYFETPPGGTSGQQHFGGTPEPARKHGFLEK